MTEQRVVMNAPTGHVTVSRTVLAELVKLRSVRSVVYALVAAALTVAASGVVTAVGIAVTGAGADPLGGTLNGVTFAAYIMAAVGALAVTGEYSGGTIRTTLAAVPHRGRLVAGKVIAVVTVVFTVAAGSVFLTFLTAERVLSSTGFPVSWTAPGVLRVLVGAALYMTVVAVLGVGSGLVLRSTGGAVALVIGVLTLPSLFALLLPDDVADRVVPLLPDSAGAAILNLTRNASLSPWAGLAVFAGYAAVTIAGATMLFRRRDA